VLKEKSRRRITRKARTSDCLATSTRGKTVPAKEIRKRAPREGEEKTRDVTARVRARTCGGAELTPKKESARESTSVRPHKNLGVSQKALICGTGGGETVWKNSEVREKGPASLDRPDQVPRPSTRILQRGGGEKGKPGQNAEASDWISGGGWGCPELTIGAEESREHKVPAETVVEREGGINRL